MQANLMQKNHDHAQRAEVLMKQTNEMQKGLVEILMDGRVSQDKLESLIVSINDPLRQREDQPDTRMSAMAAIMTEKDQQTDERFKHISDLMHRRHTDVDKRLVDQMTTIQGLTLGVNVVVTQPHQYLVVPHLCQWLLTPRLYPLPVRSQQSSSPNGKCSSVAVTQSEQTKQPKLQPSAMYEKWPAKTQVPKVIQTDLRFCEVPGPLSFDPARGALTTGAYYSVASSQMTTDMEYRTATEGTEYLLQPGQILLRSTCFFPLEITPQGHCPRVRKGIPPEKKYTSGNKRRSANR